MGEAVGGVEFDELVEKERSALTLVRKRSLLASLSPSGW